MYYNQELGLCIEFGPGRVDSVRRGGGAPLPGSNPPCAGSRRHGLLPGLLVIACYLSFTPSSLKFAWPGLQQQTIEVVGDVLETNTCKPRRCLRPPRPVSRHAIAIPVRDRSPFWRPLPTNRMEKSVAQPGICDVIGGTGALRWRC